MLAPSFGRRCKTVHPFLVYGKRNRRKRAGGDMVDRFSYRPNARSIPESQDFHLLSVDESRSSGLSLLFAAQPFQVIVLAVLEHAAVKESFLAADNLGSDVLAAESVAAPETRHAIHTAPGEMTDHPRTIATMARITTRKGMYCGSSSNLFTTVLLRLVSELASLYRIYLQNLHYRVMH